MTRLSVGRWWTAACHERVKGNTSVASATLCLRAFGDRIEATSPERELAVAILFD